MATEILHHHPNSKMEDYSSIYELMKHSSVKDYLMVSLLAGDLDCTGSLHSALLFGSPRLVKNTPFTSCYMATLWMQSVSCLLLRAGGMGKCQLIRNQEENSLRPTGVYWIISSGVTKKASFPTQVGQNPPQPALYLLLAGVQTDRQHHLLVKPKNRPKAKKLNLVQVCLIRKHVTATLEKNVGQFHVKLA